MTLESLRELCSRYWNPIGIPMEGTAEAATITYRPLPRDEYDHYLEAVADMVREGSSPNAIITYLQMIEQDHLMLSAPDGDKTRFVNEVIARFT